MIKHNYEYIKEYFKNNNCELLEYNYINSKTDIKYKCDCGSYSITTFNRFRKGSRCKQCGINKNIKTQSYSQEYVYNYFKQYDCELLDKYKNKDISINYKCHCGNIDSTTFGSFKNKKYKKCRKCIGLENYSHDYVYNYFKDNGCELLESKYINNKQKLKYKCECGNINTIKFNTFASGGRCKECGITKTSGKNHYKWINDRDILTKTEQIVNEFSKYKYKFKKKYNIENGYHIDHIFPIKAFVDYGIYDSKLISCDENLQPLSPKENMSKGGKYVKKDFERWLIIKSMC